jgi:hypothetical protein
VPPFSGIKFRPVLPPERVAEKLDFLCDSERSEESQFDLSSMRREIFRQKARLRMAMKHFLQQTLKP